ncbi:MAG: class I SAM-dependent methyltransferase, partial [Gemmatimonadota bacterium]|nr:class I SAM-dependent methyltransferase [Gemmatimonadota bacterium]
AHRPRYPDALFSWLAAVAPGRSLVWEPGAGSGQASVGLAGYFDHVVATELSAEMLERAEAHPRVAYSVGVAEASGLPDHSVDLVAVAQALHWFDLDRFYTEVRRVLVPDGVLAAWSYGVLQLQGPEVNRVFQNFYTAIASWWPPERRHVEDGYRSIPFPFAALEHPPFQMMVRWPLDSLLGYCRSWSAVVRARKDNQPDPVEALESRLAPLWGDRGEHRIVSWPLSVRAGQMTP